MVDHYPYIFLVAIKMKTSLACWLFLLLVAVAMPHSSQSVHTTYLIRPNTSTPCPPSTTDRCLTLQEFAMKEEPEGSTTTDITLELMSGVHNLSTSIVVKSIQNFSIHPLCCDSEVEVMCSTSAGLKFYNISKYLSVKQISFSFCGVELDLGAILIESASHVQLSQVTITHSPGSALVVNNSLLVNVNSTVIRDSYATGLRMNNSTATFMANNTFMYNSGSALVAFTSRLYFNGRTIFKDNTAYNGGGMNLFNSTVELINWAEFVNNTAVHKGGAINMLYGSIKMLGVAWFSNNTAYNGGGINLFNSTVELINWAEFVNNTAVQNGGAINMLHGSMNMLGVAWFSKNTAQIGGGAIVVNRIKTFNISGNATFKRNKAINGGAVLIYDTTSALQLMSSTVLLFDGNSAKLGGAMFVLKSRNFNLTGTIVFSGNSAVSGSAMLVWFVSSLYWSGWTFLVGNRAYYDTIIIINCSTVVAQGEHTFQSNVAMKGTPGMYLSNISHLKFNGNTTFLCNSGIYGALWMYNVTSAELNRNLTFVGNFAEVGGSMVLGEYTTFIIKGSSAILFTSNHAATQGGAIYLYKSTLSIQSGTFIAESNSAGVSGGAVCSSASSITLNTTVKFINNSAVEGGAYYQTGESRLILGNKANVLFSENTAKEGGAIFAVDENFCGLSDLKRCFFQLHYKYVETYFIFKDNSAANAGNVLYGGWIEECHFETSTAQKYNFYDISYISDSIGANNLTTIASDPYKVCPCMNGTLQCSIKSVALPPMYPGQAFTVSVAAVGQEYGIVPSSVEATFGQESNASVDFDQISQTTKATCTSLKYTLYSPNKNENMNLTIVGKCQYASQKLLLKIRLLECPEGFELLGSPAQCMCQKRLLEYTKKCTIDDQKIHRTTNFWSGYDNATQGLVLYPHCPFDYCTPPPNKFTMEHSDLQCSYNRTRLLCGQCRPGFSLALGTSRCLKCSNYYLALLPVFAVVGLVLVIFLFVCRLTLARGTINGLVFYANLVHTNRTLFFPTTEINVFNVFIAWLNLDLGLETCLYNGMDTYARMWLQFAFPLYLWVLCGCIVFISSKSYRMSRLLGTNPVAVLATLFLLSYTNLLHTAFSALSFTTLSYPQHNTKLVWLYDANIQYLHGKHIPLFVVGLAALLLCLPYAVLLLASQWLHAWSNCCLFHWVNSHRVKFLLDAHNAPFKTKHCYWTGLLLLTRCMLYFINAVNVLGNGSVNILATCIAVTTLMVWMGVSEQPYKSQLLGIIEALFLLNILILSMSTLYIRSTQGNQAALAYTSTTISLAVFVTILLFHAYLGIKHTKVWKTLTAKRLKDPEITNQDGEDDEQMVASGTTTHSEIVIPQHTGYAERMPASPMTERDIQHNLSESQSLQQHERAPAPPELSDNVDFCSSWQTWDNVSMPYTEAELREPLLSSDDYS